MFGTYWDDAWHTDRGRDSFAIPPHLTLYGGVLVASLVLAGWGLRSWRQAGWGARGVRVVLGQRPLLLAGIGGAATLAAVPVDNLWHARYGRDAVLWSPPHMLAVAASVALAVGLLTGLRAVPGVAGSVARAMASAGVLAALLVPVLEYDNDVPQFSPVFYLPVVTAGTLLGFLVVRAAAPGRWAVTLAAAAVTALRAVTVLVLAGLHMTLTFVPPVLAVAVVDDLLAHRRFSDRTRGLVLALLVPLSWAPALTLQADTAMQVPVELLPQTVAGCLAAVIVVLALTGRLGVRGRGPTRPSPTGVGRSGRRLTRAARGATVLMATVLPFLPAPAPAQAAVAHDPGQGTPVGTAALAVTRSGDQVTLTAVIPGGCQPSGGAGLPTAVVSGRRAGLTIQVVARARTQGARTTPTCAYTGTLDLSASGRWFVYLDAPTVHGTQETWLSLPAGAESATSQRQSYLPSPRTGRTGELVVGVLLYLLVAALLTTSVRLATAEQMKRDSLDHRRPGRPARTWCTSSTCSPRS